MSSKAKMSEELQEGVSIDSPKDRRQYGSLSDTIRYSHAAGLAVTSLHPTMLLHVDEGNNSDYHCR